MVPRLVPKSNPPTNFELSRLLLWDEMMTRDHRVAELAWCATHGQLNQTDRTRLRSDWRLTRDVAEHIEHSGYLVPLTLRRCVPCTVWNGTLAAGPQSKRDRRQWRLTPVLRVLAGLAVAGTTALPFALGVSLWTGGGVAAGAAVALTLCMVANGLRRVAEDRIVYGPKYP